MDHVACMGEIRNAYNFSHNSWRESPLSWYRCIWEDNNKMDLKRNRVRGHGLDSIWLGTGTSGGLLWMWQWTFTFHKRHGSWLAEQLLATQEDLCFVELLAFVYTGKEQLWQISVRTAAIYAKIVNWDFPNMNWVITTQPWQ
jgi:hypothetical protein